MKGAVAVRVALLLLAVAALATGVAGGLARMGAPVALAQATAFHGALMVSGFLGTVIGLERAVALGLPAAFAAPLAAGLGTVALLLGHELVGAALWMVAPVALFAASVAIVRRQAANHTVLLAVAALAWLASNVCFALGAAHLVWPWGFAFLVLTIAAERLEMTRLMRRRPAAQPLFFAVTGLMLAGAVLTAFDERMGAVAYGASLVAMAAWLAVFDIARRTVRTEGFARYAAVALLGGYAWLAIAGVAWAAMPFVPAARDTALHALGLGFVFSMILAHAPLIVPVIARVAMRFVPFFYVPLALLHASLVLRLAAGSEAPAARLAGGSLNAAALIVFVATLVYAIATGRRAPAARPAAPQGAPQRRSDMEIR